MAFAERSLAFGREPRQSAELLERLLSVVSVFPAVKTMKKCHKLEVF
jgi:hypothetical protein